MRDDHTRPVSPVPSKALCPQKLARLELLEEAVDLLLLLERREAVVERVAGDLGPGLADGLGAGDALLHPVERGPIRARANPDRGVGRVLGRPGTPVPGDETVALRFFVKNVGDEEYLRQIDYLSAIGVYDGNYSEPRTYVAQLTMKF